MGLVRGSNPVEEPVARRRHARPGPGQGADLEVVEEVELPGGWEGAATGWAPDVLPAALGGRTQSRAGPEVLLPARGR